MKTYSDGDIVIQRKRRSAFSIGRIGKLMLEYHLHSKDCTASNVDRWTVRVDGRRLITCDSCTGGYCCWWE